MSVGGLWGPKETEGYYTCLIHFPLYPLPPLFQARPKKKKPSLLKKQMLSSIHFYKQIPEGINNLQIAKSEQSVGSGRAPCHKQIDLGYHPHLLTYSYLIHF